MRVLVIRNNSHRLRALVNQVRAGEGIHSPFAALNSARNPNKGLSEAGGGKVGARRSWKTQPRKLDGGGVPMPSLTWSGGGRGGGLPPKINNLYIKCVLSPFLLGGLPCLACSMSPVCNADRDTLPQTLCHETVRVIRHGLNVVPGTRSVPSKHNSIRSVRDFFAPG